MRFHILCGGIGVKCIMGMREGVERLAIVVFGKGSHPSLRTTSFPPFAPVVVTVPSILTSTTTVCPSTFSTIDISNVLSGYGLGSRSCPPLDASRSS